MEYILIGLIIWAAVFGVVWSLCIAAGDADRQTEKFMTMYEYERQREQALADMMEKLYENHGRVETPQKRRDEEGA